MKKLALALLGLLFAASVAHAQAPPAVPVVPDADRYQGYNLSVSTPTLDVPFPVYGDCTDLKIELNSTVLALGTDWTCASASGVAVSLIPLPVTDLVVTFTSPPSSGFLQIWGAWHPRRLTQPSAPGITRYEFNETLSGMIASLREIRLLALTASQSVSSVPWASIVDTPTTLTGYGITSPLPTAQGGTGAASPTGYEYFNGGSAPTFAATITTATANPSATIGLAAIDGSSTSAMRADAAPALSQAIAPTWTGLHTWTLTNGGLASAGNPHISASYIGPTQLFGMVFNATAANAAEAETTAIFNMTSSVGYTATPSDYFKEALAATMTLNPGSSDGWAQSNVVNLNSGAGNITGIALEVDVNVANQAYSSFGPTYAAGLYITGTASAGDYGSCAICMDYRGSTTAPLWYVGIYLGYTGYRNYQIASILDQTNSPEVLLDQGAHNYGYDASNATFAVDFLIGPSSTFRVDGSGNLVAAAYTVGSTAGLTCPGITATSFRSVSGIVTHC